jgi:hypothetical protein
MPTTYNEFQDKQEEFWKAVRERFQESEIIEFNKFFVPLFYIDELSISFYSHPLNVYGADRATNENIDALRTKITDDYTSGPVQLLRYMFEEEDHPIYEALFAMISTYKDLGNTVRAEADAATAADTDMNSD